MLEWLKKKILGHYERKQRTDILAETQQKVLDFYEYEETSRMLPGIKDKVSIKKNMYHQKRLLLGIVHYL